MAKIIGNTTATPNPRPDWMQTDPNKADYIKNKFVTNADLTVLTEPTKGYYTHIGESTEEFENGVIYYYDGVIFSSIKGGSGNDDLNAENGIGMASLVIKTGDDPEVDYINYTQEDAGIALGDLNRADGRKAIALGTQNNVSAYIPTENNPSYADAVANGKIYYLAEDKSRYILIDNNLSEETYNSIETVYEYIRTQANSSVAVGQVNTVYGNCGGAFGNTNTLDINGGNSYVFGKNNYLDSYRSFVAGENNRGENGQYHQFILGDNNIALGDKEVLLGTGLKSSATYQTTVGKFNEDKPDALFVVGAGGSDGARRNILEVEHHLANLNGTLNINDHFNVGGNSTLKGNLSVRANPNDKNVESFYVNQYGAYDIGGKLSNASNLRNGGQAGSFVAGHVSNNKANDATGIGSFAGGSASFWQGDGANTTVSGNNSIAWGYKTTVTADHSYGLGWGINIKNGTRKLAYGIYNEDKANTVFEIGKGNNDTDRKNIFEITDDGTAKFNKLTDGTITKTVTEILAGSDSGEFEIATIADIAAMLNNNDNDGGDTPVDPAPEVQGATVSIYNATVEETVLSFTEEDAIVEDSTLVIKE